MGEEHQADVVQSITVEAVVIRADGTKEDLGVVAHWDADDPPSKLRRIWLSITRKD